MADPKDWQKQRAELIRLTALALDEVALEALRDLSDEEVYRLPVALQTAEIKRRMMPLIWACKDEATLEQVCVALGVALPERKGPESR